MTNADKSVEIVKANGEREPFMTVKLENSLLRTGADPEVIEEIVEEIVSELEDGMTTRYIYNKAFDLLSHKRANAASRYSLREAVMDLGPTGFPFEEFISRIFATRGYEVETDVYLDGVCSEHEVDVVAHNNEELILIEAKFHNERGITSDIKTALYVKARFDDLKDRSFHSYDEKKMTRGLLITNTKFSSSALKYGECAGLEMVGWNYPAVGNLQDYIEESGLQPLTILSNISSSTKKHLIDEGTVLCRDLYQNPGHLHAAGLSDDEVRSVTDEIQNICKI